VTAGLRRSRFAMCRVHPAIRYARQPFASITAVHAPLAQLAEQRTLNPRVRGSSPWRRTRNDLGFYRPRSFFMCPFCPRGCSMVARAHGPRNPGLSKTAHPAPGAGAFAPERRRRAGPVPPRALWTNGLDLHGKGTRSAPGVPIPMPSHTVRPAGKRHSDGGYAGGADAPSWPVTCQGCAGQRPRASGWRCRVTPALEAASPLGTSVSGSFRATLGSAVTAAARGGYWRARQAGAARPQPGRMPGPGGISRCRARSRPAGGCVRPGRPTAGAAGNGVVRGSGRHGFPFST
jgi:hypothetical protein